MTYLTKGQKKEEGRTEREETKRGGRKRRDTGGRDMKY